jgi:hypothetical protein
MKVEIKGWITLETGRWVDGGKQYSIYPLQMNDMTCEGRQYIPIREESFTVEIPDDFDPRPQIVATLREQKQQILADAHVKAEAIEEQIQQMLCLEYKESS